MPADEKYDVAHERNKRTTDDRPGCYNRAPYAAGYYAPNRRYRPDGSFFTCVEFIKTNWIQYERCPNTGYAECGDCKWQQPTK